MNESRNPEETIFEAARQLPAEERAAFLEKACGNDAQLRQRVDALLQSDAEAAGFLESPPQARGGSKNTIVLTMPVTEKPGDRIGRYKILQQIGEGGCGVVYMAEQSEPVRRKVALKVIKLGMDTRSVIARFEAERQALAMMDHPNIAKVLDAGATDAGRPYFVMELVRGIPITKYCDENNLPTPERLGLFMSVCHAIQHAHQKGVIHRDIKPSNILVTLHDGVPVPKVIDFGIAKATEARLTDLTLFTELNAFIGTPAYMSPEQAEMSGLDIDTRADIYSLGVLLYELLSGKLPFDPEALLKAGLDEMRRTIREVEPPRPSTRLSTLAGGDLSAIAKHRGTEATKLSTLLRGELDWIVMKALEKDRTRRYESASTFAQDIRRYLGNEAVLACPPSATYLFQKLVRRHRLVFAAGAAVAMALVAGVVGIEWQRRVAVAARRDADERGQTAISAAKSEREQAEQARLASMREREQRQEAVRQQKLAELERDTAKRNLYVAESHLAQNSWEASDLVRLQESLARQAPRAGERDYRGWEWHYLDAQSRGLISLRGHALEVDCLAWSPDGKWLASSAEDEGRTSGELKVWDAETGREIAALGGLAPYGILTVAWSPDGRRLAAGGGRTGGFKNNFPGELKIWNVAGGQEVLALRGHMGAVNSVAWSHDGSRLASASGEFSPPGEVKIWDPANGKELLNLPGHSNQVNRVAWSPDDRLLASASTDRTIKLWNTRDGKEIRTLRGHSRAVYTVVWSPDGQLLATTGAEPSVKIWEAASGKEVQGFSAPRDVSVGWTLDGKQLEITHNSGKVEIWDTTARQFIRTNKSDAQPGLAVAWSPDHRRLALATTMQTITVKETNPLPEALVLRGGKELVAAVAWAPDGQRLATAGENIKIWDLAGRQVQTLTWPSNWVVLAMGWSPDGRAIISSSLRQMGGTIRVLDTQTAEEISTWSAGFAPVFSVALSPDGRAFATGDFQGSVSIWDAKVQDKKLAKLEGHAGRVSSVAWHPHQPRLASAGADATIRLWNLDQGLSKLEKAAVLQGHAGGVNSVTWSPDGQHVASGGTDGVKVWDAETGALQLNLRGHSGPVFGVAWRPDAGTDRQRLASVSADGTLKVWDVGAGQEVLTLHGNKSSLRSVSWSPDGQRLAAGSEDGMIKVWNASPAARIHEKSE